MASYKSDTFLKKKPTPITNIPLLSYSFWVTMRNSGKACKKFSVVSDVDVTGISKSNYKFFAEQRTRFWCSNSKLQFPNMVGAEKNTCLKN